MNCDSRINLVSKTLFAGFTPNILQGIPTVTQQIKTNSAVCFVFAAEHVVPPRVTARKRQLNAEPKTPRRAAKARLDLIQANDDKVADAITLLANRIEPRRDLVEINA